MFNLQSVRSYFNNNRYRDLSTAEVDGILSKVREPLKNDLYYVVKRHHEEALKDLMKIDTEPGVEATKMKRAAKALLESLSEKEVKALGDEARTLKNEGADVQMQLE